ncbi:MAG: phosphoribosyltransferase family protein [Planctomycetota bacterium]
MSCSECKAERLEFDGCVPLWTYDGLVRQAIVSAKYGNRVALADALGNCLAGRLAMSPWIGCPDVVTAIPSHPFRRVQRGDGGSRVLAEAVAGRLKRLPSVSGTDSSYRKLSYRDLISSARRVKKQAWLGEKERRENVKGAFRLRRGLVGGVASAKPLANRHILLVDDVMTTGATASEAAKVLKLAGARQVTVAVVARAT